MIKKLHDAQWIFVLIKSLLVVLLLGRAYQHLFWQPPYDIIIFDSRLSGLVSWLSGWSWEEFLAHENLYFLLNKVYGGLGSALLIFALYILLINPKKASRFIKYALVFTTGILLLLSFSYFRSKNHIGQLLESTIQWSLPFLYWQVLNDKPYSNLVLLIKIAIAITFIGHGLYAIGYFPVPGHFVQMLINVFGCSEETCLQILWFAGAFDFVAAFALFITPFQRIALIYCIIWGSITAFARLAANVSWQFFAADMHQWGFECFVRLGHGGLPLVLYLILTGIREKSTSHLSK